MTRLLRVGSLLFLMGLQPLSAWSQPQLFWQQSDGPYGAVFRTLFVDPATGDVWAGTAGDGVYHSTDGGEQWTYKGLTPQNISAITINADGDIFAGSHRSTDGGTTWVRMGLPDTL